MTTAPATARRVPFSVLLLSRFGVLVCAVLLALGALFYFGLNWLARGVADDSGARAAELLQVRTQAYLDEAGASVRLMAGYMQTLGDRGTATDREAVWRMLWGTMRNAPSIDSLYIADAEGGYTQVSRDPEIVTRAVDRSHGSTQELRIYRDSQFRPVREERSATTYDPRTRPWFRSARPDLVSFTAEASDTGTARHAAVAVAFSVPGRGTGQVVGASVPLVRFNDFVRQARPTPASVVLLLNADGEVLATTGLATDAPATRQDAPRMTHVKNLGYPPLSESYARFMAGGAAQPTLDLAGKQYRFQARRFGGVGWVTMVLTPEEEALGQFSTLAVIVLYVLGAVFLAALLALMKLSRDLSLPITRLAAEAANIRAFALERYRGVDSHIQEVAELGDALDSAVDALKGFKRYVPADLVRQLLASPEFARVGGREADLTLFFSDIIGFTGITERMAPESLMRQMSDYFEVMTLVIMRHHGTVDKYIGDGIMAFWGAPTNVDDAPARACRAALECQQRIIELNRTWVEEGKPAFETCIGIHTGRVVVGNFGSSDRLNYSAIGDGVNLAARIETLNRELSTRILISGETHALLGGRFACRAAAATLRCADATRRLSCRNWSAKSVWLARPVEPATRSRQPHARLKPRPARARATAGQGAGPEKIYHSGCGVRLAFAMIGGIDHIVLTTRDLDQCIGFYTQVLGMQLERYGNGRIALRFGEQKFNVHPPGFEAGIKAAHPTPGSLDLCFLADCPLEDVMARLKQHDIALEVGPVVRSGARFAIRSVYVRDPDDNLVEIAVPDADGDSR